MYNQIGIDQGVTVGVAKSHSTETPQALHRAHLRSEADVDARRRCPRDESVDELGIEPYERPLSTVKNRDAGTSTSGNMRELERDVSTPDERQCRWQ